MKTKMKLKLITFLLVLPLLAPAASELEAGTIEFTIGKRFYRFSDNLMVKVKRLDEFNYRLIIGLEDRARRAELLISAEIPVESIKENQHLNLNYSRLTFMFKTPGKQYMLLPATRMARPVNFDQGRKRFKNMKTKRAKQKRRDWRFMKRSERLKQGLGVIRNRKMDGSEFFMNIEPVVKDDEIKEFRGSFSGLVGKSAQARKSGKAIRIQGGKFRVEFDN